MIPDLLAIVFSIAAIAITVASIRLNRKTRRRIAATQKRIDAAQHRRDRADAELTRLRGLMGAPIRPWEQIRECGCGLAPDWRDRNKYGEPLPRGVVPCPVHLRTGPPDFDD